MTDTPPDNGDDALAQAEEIMAAASAEFADATNDDAPTADPTEADEAAADTALVEAEAKAAEHLADLQRLQAEYVNYRKRVDRDRAAATDHATMRFIESLIPVLDDIAAARDHGDLAEGPFAAIATKLEDTLSKYGWQRYGEAGDAFDPTVHEALMSQPSADVTEPTVTEVAQPGHRVGEVIVRPARVLVAQPE